ncbi:MAG: ATP-binding protein [Rickettsiales bacterium]|nr:ATP-binding protein [Rickettsiales bacterium]
METLSTYKNLKLLWWLRNIAIAGQVIAISVVTQLLSIPLQLTPLSLILGLSAALNMLTWWRISHMAVITEREFFIHLLLDMLALTGLLYFTGGATNPFTSLFILQVVFAAVTLPALYTWITAAIAIGIYTALMFWNIQVPYLQHHHIGDFFSLHVQGMWVSFILLACIVAWFVVRMNATIRRQDALLAEAEKVAALGTLATSAVHELGTPLATISVLAGDCDTQTSSRLLEQIARCKQILSSITTAGGVARAESSAPVQLDTFFTQLTQEWKKDHAAVMFNTDFSSLGKERILVEHGFKQAIINLLNNAADASPNYVKLTAESTSQLLVIEIQDKGNGIADGIKESLGVAGVTSKAYGLGLGLFIAKSVVTRLGGTLILEDTPDKGITATISLPIKKLTV